MDLSSDSVWKSIQKQIQRHPYTGEPLYPLCFRTTEPSEGIIYLEGDTTNVFDSSRPETSEGLLPESFLKSLCHASESVKPRSSRLVLLSSIPIYMTIRDVFTFIWTNVPAIHSGSSAAGGLRGQDKKEYSSCEGDAVELRGFSDTLSCDSRSTIHSEGYLRDAVFEEACILPGQEPDTFSLLITTQSPEHSKRMCDTLKDLPIDSIDNSKLASIRPVAALLQRSVFCNQAGGISNKKQFTSISTSNQLSAVLPFPIWYMHAIAHEVTKAGDTSNCDTASNGDVNTCITANSDIAQVAAPPLESTPITRSISINFPTANSRNKSDKPNRVDESKYFCSEFLTVGDFENMSEGNRSNFSSHASANIVGIGVNQSALPQFSDHQGRPYSQIMTPSLLSKRNSAHQVSELNFICDALDTTTVTTRSTHHYSARARTPTYMTIVPSELPPPQVITPSTYSPILSTDEARNDDAAVSTATPLHYLSALAVATARNSVEPVDIQSIRAKDGSEESQENAQQVHLQSSQGKEEVTNHLKCVSSSSPSTPPAISNEAMLSMDLPKLIAFLKELDCWISKQSLSSKCPICLDCLYSVHSSCKTQTVHGPECSNSSPMAANSRPILTILCGHSFHFECLSHWTSHACPLCRRSLLPESADPRCAECGSTRALWLCLLCGHIGCGRYSGSHAASHFTQTGHALAMDFTKPTRVWDYVADSFVSRVLAVKGGNELVALELDEDDESSSCTERTTVAVAEAAEIVVTAGVDIPNEVITETPPNVTKSLVQSVPPRDKMSVQSPILSKTIHNGVHNSASSISKLSPHYTRTSSRTQVSDVSQQQSDTRDSFDSRVRTMSALQRVPSGLQELLSDFNRSERGLGQGESKEEVDPSALQQVWATSLKLERVVQEYNQLLTTQMISQRNYFEEYLRHSYERHNVIVSSGKDKLAQIKAQIALEESKLNLAREDLICAKERESDAVAQLEAAKSEESELRAKVTHSASEVQQAAEFADQIEAKTLELLKTAMSQRDEEIESLEETLADIRFSIRAQRLVKKSDLRDDIMEGRIMYP